MSSVRFQTWLAWLLLALIFSSTQANEAPALPAEIKVNGVDFVLIPAGWFSYSIANGKLYQGLPKGVPEYRDLQIWLDSYYIAKYEASARDLARFLNSPQASDELKQQHLKLWTHGGEAEIRSGSGCTLTQDAQGRFVPVDDTRLLPATYLSWNQAVAFARWMGFRLPTDAEWQKAARGSDSRIWPWGDSYPDDTYALFNSGRACMPADIRAYPKGRSPYGLYNMVGNVSEHIAHGYLYPQDAQLKDGDRNPLQGARQTDAKPSQYIRRGGSWSSDPHSFTNAYRRYNRPNRAPNSYGARFAIDAEQVRAWLATGEASTMHTGKTPP